MDRTTRVLGRRRVVSYAVGTGTVGIYRGRKSLAAFRSRSAVCPQCSHRKIRSASLSRCLAIA